MSAHLTQAVIHSGERRGTDDAGWAAVTWPREYGGRDALPIEQLVYAEEIWCQGMSEPEAGSDLASLAPAQSATVTTHDTSDPSHDRPLVAARGR